VVTKDQFDAHLESLKKAGQIGAPRGGVNSRNVSQEAPSGQSGGE
jgi:hypothetical protein